MSIPSSRVSALILEQLGVGEKRVLSLVVAVRKALVGTEALKGDLSVAVQSALRALVASGAVVDAEGMYSLAPQNELPLVAADSHVVD